MIFVSNVGRRPSEGSNFDHFPAKSYVRQTKSSADEPTISEQLSDFLGMRVGGNVEIFGYRSEQQISDATADQISLIARFVQGIENLQRAAADIGPRNVMRGPGNYMRFADGTVPVLRTKLFGIVDIEKGGV
jgi:hypothetical protein